MGKFWNFLRDPDNRGALAAIGGFIVVLVSAIWIVYTYTPLSSQKSQEHAESGLQQPQSRNSDRDRKTADVSVKAEYHPPSSTVEMKCNSPSDFVRRIYSKDRKTIEYAIDFNPAWSQVRVAFYGKRGVVLRTNTYVTLEKPAGVFAIPERVMIKPEQRWFNFVASLSTGCEQWGLVSEEALQSDGNRIGIGDPSGEGAAFVIK